MSIDNVHVQHVLTTYRWQRKGTSELTAQYKMYSCIDTDQTQIEICMPKKTIAKGRARVRNKESPIS